MRTLFIIRILFMLGCCLGLELIQAFGEQTCTRGSVFSLQIDDHFDEVILNASVIEPSFLSISNRTVGIKQIGSIKPSFGMNYTSIDFYDEKVLILEGFGIILYKGISSNKYISIVEPVLVQYFRDLKLDKYEKIRGGTSFVVFNSTSVLFFVIKDQKFPVQIAGVHSFTNIIEVIVDNDNFIVIESIAISIYTVIDYETGWTVNLQFLNLQNLKLGNLYVSTCYIKDSTLYLLDPNIGVLEFTNYLNFKRLLKFPGSLISGYENYLLVDNIEININTLATKTYNFINQCVYTSINSQFVFCANTKTITTASRKLDLYENKFIGIIHDLRCYKDLIFVGLYNRVEIYQANLGSVYINGRTPDDVREYGVTFEVSNEGGSVREGFVLSVQYSLTNVIIFILLSFITVFGLVFVCSFLCKCINKEQPEFRRDILPVIDAPVLPLSDRVLGSSDRNLASDRELLPGRR